MKTDANGPFGLYVFPTPFGGIQYAFRLTTRSRLQMAVEYMLLGCSRSHEHNFAIETDHNTIYTTKLGTECIARLLETVDDQ